MAATEIPIGGIFGSNVEILALTIPGLTRIQISSDSYVFNITSTTNVPSNAQVSFSAPQVLGQRIRLIFTSAAPNTCLMDPSFDTYLRMIGPWQPTTNNTIEFISNGSFWVETNRTPQSSVITSWATLTGLSAGWVNLDSEAILINQIVYMRGRLQNVSGGPLTGPIGYLPSASMYPVKPFVMSTSMLIGGTTVSPAFLGMNVTDIGLVETFTSIANGDAIVIGSCSFPMI